MDSVGVTELGLELVEQVVKVVALLRMPLAELVEAVAWHNQVAHVVVVVIQLRVRADVLSVKVAVPIEQAVVPSECYALHYPKMIKANKHAVRAGNRAKKPIRVSFKSLFMVINIGLIVLVLT